MKLKDVIADPKKLSASIAAALLIVTAAEAILRGAADFLGLIAQLLRQAAGLLG